MRVMCGECFVHESLFFLPDVLPVYRLKELMTFDLIHTHSSDSVLCICTIPEAHKQEN